ncbi:MAG TPA: AI-2E family transporter, partial [Clostridiales bacterium]|nr:AI-2E family transporter [Clostridiales bacterium]
MFKESKIPYIELLPIIVLSFILYKLISNISSLTEAISPIIGIFVWAFCIAYILNPLMIYLEKKLKLSRMWSLILTYVIFIGIIILIVTILTPKVISSVSDLLVSIPDYLDMAQKWIKDSADKIELYNKSNGNLEQKTREIIETVSKYLTKGLNTMLSSAVNVTFSFVKGIFIIIISIYILKDKNSLKRTVTRFIYAFTADDKADRLMDAFSEINGIFSRFILGKSLDSIIIGILCFIGLKL